jgi:hypothetical protein
MVISLLPLVSSSLALWCCWKLCEFAANLVGSTFGSVVKPPVKEIFRYVLSQLTALKRTRWPEESVLREKEVVVSRHDQRVIEQLNESERERVEWRQSVETEQRRMKKQLLDCAEQLVFVKKENLDFSRKLEILKHQVDLKSVLEKPVDIVVSGRTGPGSAENQGAATTRCSPSKPNASSPLDPILPVQLSPFEEELKSSTENSVVRGSEHQDQEMLLTSGAGINELVSNLPPEYPSGVVAEIAKDLLEDLKEQPSIVTLKELPVLSFEEICDVVPSAIHSKILSKNFKERLSGFSELNVWFRDRQDAVNLGFRYIMSLGFKETNVTVCSYRWSFLANVVARSSVFSSDLVHFIFPFASNQIGDAKIESSICACWFEISACVGADKLSRAVFKSISDVKSPKSISKIYLFLTRLVKDFGLQAFDVLHVIDESKKCISSANAKVREAAMQLLVEISRQSGTSFHVRMLELVS